MMSKLYPLHIIRYYAAALFWIISIILLAGGCGPQEQTVYRVGILSGTDAFLDIAAGFKAAMVEAGYIEGQNIVYDMQTLNADPEGEKRIARQFVADQVDLIFAYPTEPALAAKIATQGTDIPVVFAYAGIEEANLVDSVRRPGGNITGVRFPGPELSSKRLEFLHELAPQVKRVWISYDQTYPTNAPALALLRPTAESLGVTLVEVPVTTLAELEADLVARAQADDPGIDALLLMPDIFNHSPDGWGMIQAFGSEHRLPIAGSFLYTVEQGAVFGTANDLFKVGELAAPLADEILKGTPAGSIPVVSPEKDLWINYQVAQDLGLIIPDGLLNQAAAIIR